MEIILASGSPRRVENMEIVLASGSPRRRELMEQAGIACRIIPATGDEESNAAEPAQYVQELARHKAEEVADRLRQEEPEKKAVIIGADTIVVVTHENGTKEILGKPKAPGDARRMIRLIAGRTHTVMTGCAVIHLDGDCLTFVEETRVHVFPMSDEEIEDYIATPEPYDKAGGYGIQGSFGIYIEGISGDYNNVVGLPIARLYHVLRDAGCLT